MTHRPQPVATLATVAVVFASLAAGCSILPAAMKTYAYPKYGFSADFPARPTVGESIAPPAAAGQTPPPLVVPGVPQNFLPRAAAPTIVPQPGAHVAVVDAKSLGRDFAVSVSDVDPTRDIDALADAAAAGIARTVGGAVSYSTYCATPDGLIGREQVIAKGGGRAVRLRVYRVGARLYVLTARSTMGVNPNSPDVNAAPDPGTVSGRDDDPSVTAFLSSFHAGKA